MRPTRSGAAVGAAGPVLAGAGLATGYPELFMLAFGCVAALVAAVAWGGVSRSRLRARSTYLPQRPRQGERLTATIRVVNEGRRRSGAVTVTETVVGERHTVRIPALQAGGEHLGTYGFAAPRRGLLDIRRAEVAALDPLGLLRTTVAAAQSTQILVHPRWHGGLLPLVAAEARTGRPLAGRPRDEAELHSLRDYQRGDPVRLVHWPSTARRGVTTVRRVESPEEPLQVLLLDNAAEGYPAEAFEDAVRIAASLAVAARRAGFGLELRTSRGPGPVRLPRTGRPGPHAAALDLLSSVELVPRGASGGAVQAAAVEAVTSQDASMLDPSSLVLPQAAVVFGIVAGRLAGSCATVIAEAGRRAQAVYTVQVGTGLPTLRLGGSVQLRVADSAGFVRAWQRVAKR